MYQPSKRSLAAIAVIAAATAPSTASATVMVEGVGGPSTQSVASTHGAAISSASPVAHVAAASSQSFQWDDAAIGAAGMLVLVGVGVGSGAAVARRHRTGPLSN